MTMGERIRQLRLEKGLTQEELGEIVGVKKAAVQKWESGLTKNLKRSTIEKLSSFFGVSPSYLMGMSEIKNLVPHRLQKVPLLGEISAGEPIYASEERGSYILVNGNARIDFCLRVKGDSMIDARIHDGDLVFVRKQPCVENGEIAVVLIDNEATLKRFYRTDDGVILKPENSKYQPKYYTEKDFKDIRVLGKAVLFQSEL